jgi:hypothetical protein
VINSPTIKEYTKNLEALQKFYSIAVKYVEKTWLV